jgi:hypothetical protein
VKPHESLRGRKGGKKFAVMILSPTANELCKGEDFYRILWKTVEENMCNSGKYI